MVSIVVDFKLKGQKVFSSGLVISVFAMHADYVICSGCVETNTCCPGSNFNVSRTVLSELHLCPARAVSIYASICFRRMSSWSRNIRKSFAAVEVPSYHLVLYWIGLPWSDPVLGNTMPSRMLFARRLMYLHSVHVCLLLEKLVPVGPVLDDVVLKA